MSLKRAPGTSRASGATDLKTRKREQWPVVHPFPGRRHLSRNALLILASLAGLGSTAHAEQRPVPHQLLLSDKGNTRTLLPLPADLQNQPLSVHLLGWRDQNGRTHEQLPHGYSASHPKALPASASPFLPLSVHATPDAITGDAPQDFTLVFSVTGPSLSREVPVHVRWPAHVRFTVHGPSELRTLPDQPLTVPLRVRNSGNTDGHVTIHADLSGVSAMPLTVPAGAERTLYVDIPVITGDRVARITVRGGMQDVTHELQLLGPRRDPGTPYGLNTSLSTGVTLDPGDISAATTQTTFTTEGLLSRYTHLKGAITRNHDNTYDVAASVVFRDTRVDYAKSNANTPSGDVGKGLYVTQGVRLPEWNGEARIGVSVPSTAVPARLGVDARASVHGVGLAAGASINTDQADPNLTLLASAPGITAAATYTPDRATRWTAQAKLTEGNQSVGAGIKQSAANTDLWTETQIRSVPTPLGPAAFTVRSDWLDGQLRNLGATATVLNTTADWKWRAGDSQTLEAKTAFIAHGSAYRLRGALNTERGTYHSAVAGIEMTGLVGHTGFKLDGSAQFDRYGLQRAALTATTSSLLGTTILKLDGHAHLNQHGFQQAGLKGSTSTPVGTLFGPATVNLGFAGTTTGALDLSATTTLRGLMPGGQWLLDAGGALTSVRTSPTLNATTRVTYSSYHGWGGTLGASMPLNRPGPARVTLGLTYRTRTGTPTTLAEHLDGPDPSTRTLQVQLRDGGTLRPLAGVDLSGCGITVTTDAHGLVTVRPGMTTCTFTVDLNTLPPNTTLLRNTLEVPAGAKGIFTAVPTTTLHGRVQYTDPDTGQPYPGGPERDITVTITGPRDTWVKVRMPDGKLEVPDLPEGEYALAVNGAPPTTIHLTRQSTTLNLITPGPRRTVLDPAQVTPPVKLTWAAMVVPAGSDAQLKITSDAEITNVELTLGGQAAPFKRDDPENISSWKLSIPTPGNATGTQDVNVTIHFRNGVTAKRKTVLVLTPPTSAGKAP